MSTSGKSAFVSISVPKILLAGRKKKKQTNHKDGVRKCNLTFTGYTAVSLKTGLHINYQSPESLSVGQGRRWNTWRSSFASQGEICNINVYPRQLKIIALGLWGAAVHIVYDWGPELKSVRKTTLPSASARTTMNPMSNFSKSLYRLPDDSIHSVSILFHTLYNEQKNQQCSQKILFIKRSEHLGWFSLPF